MRERDKQAANCLKDWSGFTVGMIISTYVPKTESSLSDILEPNPHQKYFLSAKACTGILRRAEARGKELPPMLKEALERQSETVRTLDLNGGSPGVTQPIYALDRASFNQGENAQYDFQISEDDKTQTVVSRGPNAVAESPRYSVRRLTPLECERLQGFPDGWTDIPGQTEATEQELEFWREVWLTWDKTQAEDPDKVKPRTDKAILKWLKNPTSDSAQYKALGNSVAVPCPEYVLEGIKEVLDVASVSDIESYRGD